MEMKKTRRKPTNSISGHHSRNSSSIMQPKYSASMTDINESLRRIDEESSLSLRKTKQTTRRVGRNKQPWSRRRKVITWIIVSILTVALVVLGYYGYRLYHSSGAVFGGNPFDVIFKNDTLKKDQQNRTNILIFGTSEDDAGHSGAQLADSIMVLSVNQETKATSTVSIPRDLWVDYEQSCSVGTSGKINATYICGLQVSDNDEHKASAIFADKVSQVVGVDIQYYVAINYSVVRGLVDSLGGVDVDIESADSRGIYDVATGLKLSPGVNHLDGETALKLTRARNAKGGYGLPQSNFDREKNQQKVLAAIQAKALQSGTLFDPNKVVSITDSLGANVSTNLKSSELRSALDIAKGVESSNIDSLTLNSPNNRIVTTGSHNGQSIVRPVRGLTDYSGIHEYIAESHLSQ